MPLLHRQYKTARTETRWHLLLKIRQMSIQTSASRGYVLFISGNKRHTKVLKLSAGLRTHPAECSKLGKTRIIKDAGRGVVRNTGFCGQNLSPTVTAGTLCTCIIRKSTLPDTEQGLPAIKNPYSSRLKEPFSYRRASGRGRRRSPAG